MLTIMLIVLYFSFVTHCITLVLSVKYINYNQLFIIEG